MSRSKYCRKNVARQLILQVQQYLQNTWKIKYTCAKSDFKAQFKLINRAARVTLNETNLLLSVKSTRAVRLLRNGRHIFWDLLLIRSNSFQFSLMQCATVQKKKTYNVASAVLSKIGAGS